MTNNKNIGLLKRSLLTLMCMIFVIAVCFVGFSGVFAFCYEFVVDGTCMGYSSSINTYHDVVHQVNSEIISDFGEDAAIEKNVQTQVTLVKRTDITSTTELRNNVASLSEHMQNAYTLVVDGKNILNFTTKDDLDFAISEYTKKFSIDASTVTTIQQISQIEQYCSQNSLHTGQTGLDYLIQNPSIIQVSSVKDEEHTEEIEFVENLEDDSTMYEGEVNITKAGENGTKRVVTRIIYINGVENSREIITDEITKESVTQLANIGTKPRPTGLGSGSFLFPTSGTISSTYGGRWGREHKGIDIANKEGTDIIASDEGVVIFSGVQNGYGNIIILDHKNGFLSYYGHCQELLNKKGDIVEKGAVIAKMGNTGNSTGPHVHFEIRKDGAVQNPLDYIPSNQ